MPNQFFQRHGIYYGWVVIAGMFLTLFLVLGLRFSFGIFYVAILEDTGWQRAETAGIFSTSMVVYALSILFSGALFDRFGPRRVFPLGVMLLSLGIYLCSTIESLWSFYLYYGVLVGLSFSLLGFPTHMAIVPRWFKRNRGLASALALSGVGVGSLLITLLSEKLLVDIGWRSTYAIYSVVILVVLAPLNYLIHRDSPEGAGLLGEAAAESPPSGRGNPARSYTMGDALRMPVWWLLLLAVSMIGFVSMTMVVHQARLSLDLGYDLITASLLFGFTGLSRTAGQLTWGALSDRFGRNPIFLCITALGVLGILSLYLANHTPLLIYLVAFMLLFGFGFMGLSPVYAATVADLFPGRHLGKILGMLDIGFGVGSFSGPWLAGYLFDRFGNYNFTLALLILAILVAGAAMILANRIGRGKWKPV